ncbi:AAA family ATPase [Micrococcus sp. HMSC067E09]|nr:AAA family ATPase [Micrococcus sp. HMSC067E09]
MTPFGPSLPVRRVSEHALGGRLDRSAWPATVPTVAQVLDEGLDLSPATVLVGPNGAGKSTLVEAIAAAAGLNPEGGTHHVRHSTRVTESPLAEHLQLTRGAGAPRGGVFLRAEAMHGLFTHLEGVSLGSRLHEMSHGESFLAFCRERAGVRGLWVLDEPESALSFENCLALTAFLLERVEQDCQVLLSTHSPVLAALPGARILEAGDHGLRETRWEEWETVDHWRRFLAGPERYLRHL